MVEPIELNEALERLNAYLESNDLESAVAYLRTLHPADSAALLAELEPDQQAAIIERLHTDELAEVFEQLDEGDMADIAQHLDVEELADVLDEMEPDMAADLLGELEPAQAAEVLEQMEEPSDVASLMTYPPDTAGGIMTAPPPSLRRFWTVAESLQFVKKHYVEEEDFFYLYVLDRYGRLIGLVSLKALILAEPEQTIEEIMNRRVISVRVDADQEEVAQLLQRYDLVSLPVVDDEERLVGVVTIDDVVDVIEEEATEDIYKLAQLSPDSEIYSPIPESVRNRFPWLVVNLGTAFLASSVVSLFESTIAQAAVLAAFMPIVAGQGGNAGTQTMTIIVRSLALKEIEPRDTFWALWHEARVGILNGIALGILVALIAWLWKGNPYLGLVIGLAMIGNLLIAALAGVVVPMVLRLCRVDPALASSIFVTTFTDIGGFFLFLGLATYLLRYLR
uniref:Magnesium transporter MgtE n=1 Tax=Caldilinea aerophila TaxID=133453 RepID=A0A7C1JBF4_9CHLR